MAVLQCRIRKIRLPNLARDESSDDDSVNCSEINAVTWFGIFYRFLKIETFVFFTPPYYVWFLENVLTEYFFAFDLSRLESQVEIHKFHLN